MPSSFSPSSKARLTAHDVGRFGGATLFDRIGRAVCAAGCLPRKELYEGWEVARRTRRLFRGGRVIDVAGGHGLLAQIMLLLDDSSPNAVVADPAVPPSAETLHRAMIEVWPRLHRRVEFVRDPVASIALTATDVIVSCHACGTLSDEILERAASARARVAVLPCCHDFEACEVGPIAGWVDRTLAIDVMRAVRLQERGYEVRTQTIPSDITPKNRLILGAPVDLATEAGSR